MSRFSACCLFAPFFFFSVFDEVTWADTYSESKYDLNKKGWWREENQGCLIFMLKITQLAHPAPDSKAFGSLPARVCVLVCEGTLNLAWNIVLIWTWGCGGVNGKWNFLSACVRGVEIPVSQAYVRSAYTEWRTHTLDTNRVKLHTRNFWHDFVADKFSQHAGHSRKQRLWLVGSPFSVESCCTQRSDCSHWIKKKTLSDQLECRVIKVCGSEMAKMFLFFSAPPDFTHTIFPQPFIICTLKFKRVWWPAWLVAAVFLLDGWSQIVAGWVRGYLEWLVLAFSVSRLHNLTVFFFLFSPLNNSWIEDWWLI